MMTIQKIAKPLVVSTCLLLCVEGAARNSSATTIIDKELYYENIQEVQQQLTQGAITTRHLTTLFMERIQTLDKAGPSIHAVIELNPDALAIASKLDRDSKRGLLHGIPVLVKDNIDTGDRMLTSAGSLALTARAPHDADVVARLRTAGALILGKTNPSE